MAFCNMTTPIRSSALCLLLFTLTACSHLQPPDLVRIYERQAKQDKVPVIFIPGVLGSQLRDTETGALVWPGSASDLALGRKFEELALPVAATDRLNSTDNLQPAGIFMTAAGALFYPSIVDTLEVAGGYTCVDIEKLTAQSDCVLMSWDWRKDMVLAAQRLDSLIDQIRTIREAPDLQVDIIAHSAGGLVARYYARYGAVDVLDDETFIPSHVGGEKINKAILIGTPNYGSINALQQAIEGSRVGIKKLEPEILVTMPSLYQLLPHPERSWIVDTHGQRIDLDLFSVDTWKQMKWSIFAPQIKQRMSERVLFSTDPQALATYLSLVEKFMQNALRRGKRFHQALSMHSDATTNEFIVLGASCVLTTARTLLETVDGEQMIRFAPDDVERKVAGVDYDHLMLEAGDGVVTKASLLARDSLDPATQDNAAFPIAYEFFVCDEHSRLAGNMTFRDNLLNILLN